MDRKEIAYGLDFIEQGGIKLFRRHPVLSGLSGVPAERFEELLLQRRLLAFGFDAMYNGAICGLSDPQARALARETYRDEFAYSNHREDAVLDMEHIGIPRGRILRTDGTHATQQAMQGMIDAVQYCEQGPLQDTRLIAALRFGGEVLPGVEHALLLPELGRRYGLKTEDSVYFAPHATHDAKRVPLGEEGASHADRYGCVLVAAIAGAPEDAQMQFVDTAAAALSTMMCIRGRFYDQFR